MSELIWPLRNGRFPDVLDSIGGGDEINAYATSDPDVIALRATKIINPLATLERRKDAYERLQRIRSNTVVQRRGVSNRRDRTFEVRVGVPRVYGIHNEILYVSKAVGYHFEDPPGTDLRKSRPVDRNFLDISPWIKGMGLSQYLYWLDEVLQRQSMPDQKLDSVLAHFFRDTYPYTRFDITVVDPGENREDSLTPMARWLTLVQNRRNPDYMRDFCLEWYTRGMDRNYDEAKKMFWVPKDTLDCIRDLDKYISPKAAADAIRKSLGSGDQPDLLVERNDFYDYLNRLIHRDDKQAA